jgi:hypothetical protein
MAVEALTPVEVASHSLRVLGLDPESLELSSIEALAASLRRAASFMCPTTPGLLLGSVDDAIAGLPGYSNETRSLVETTLDSLVLYGDLLELPVDEEDGRRRKLFLGPPAFVRRSSGACLLLGVRPEGAHLVAEALQVDVEYDAHVRLLPSAYGTCADQLREQGLIEFQAEQWLGSPRPQAAAEAVADYVARIGATGEAGTLSGVRIIDPTRSPTFYRGRWREPKPADAGTFVARRPQGYGADLWCFVDIVAGEVRRGVDLPVHHATSPASDEAWRLQAAIDAVNGAPQRIAVRSANRVGWSVVDLFSPVPSWAQRRLDVVGTPVLRSRGALFSYSVPAAETAEEVQFLKGMMWLVESSSKETSDG